jgi:hypothetical protein
LINGEVCAGVLYSTGTVRLLQPLLATPPASSPIYGGTVFSAGTEEPEYLSVCPTLVFTCKGDEYVYTFSGCWGTVKLSGVSARSRVMLDFTFNVDSWESWDTEFPSDEQPAITLSQPIVAAGAPFVWGAAKTGISQFDFDPKREIVPILATDGANGRSGWACAKEEPSLSFSPYFAATFREDFAETAARSVVCQFGTAPGGVFAIVAPRAQIATFPNEADVNGLVGHKITVNVVDPAQVDSEDELWLQAALAAMPPFLIATF